MITICPECGHQLSAQATQCPECGYPISGQPHSGTASGTSDSGATRQTHQYKYHYKPNKSKGCRGCLIAFIIILLLALACLGGIIYGCFGLSSKVISQMGSNTIATQSEDTTEWIPDTTASHVSDDSAQPTSSEGQQAITFEGYIGGTSYPITMTLNFTSDGDVSGQYYYKQAPTKHIAVLGNYQSPYLTLYESSPTDSVQSAYFEGVFSGENFAGSYTNSGGQEYAFTLKQEPIPDHE